MVQRSVSIAWKVYLAYGIYMAALGLFALERCLRLCLRGSLSPLQVLPGQNSLRQMPRQGILLNLFLDF